MPGRGVDAVRALWHAASERTTPGDARQQGADALDRANSRPIRTSARLAILVAVVYLVAWTGLDWIASAFRVAPGVSLWVAPAALDVVLLLLFGLRWAPALLITNFVHSSVIVPVGLRWWQVGLLGLVMAASFSGGAALLTRRLDLDIGLPRLRDVVWLLVVMSVAAPLPVAVLQVVLLRGAGALSTSQLSSGVAGFWAGSATGVTMLTPVLLLLARRWTRPPGAAPRPLDLPAPRGSGASRLERVGQVLLLGATVYVAFALNGGSLNYSYLVYGPLIWIGLRGGFVPSTWAVLAINIGAVSLNRGEVPDEGGFALQFGLVTVSLLGVLLGAAVSQRQADAEAARRDALHDPLTGLPNRALLRDRLEHALARRRAISGRAAAGTTAAAVLFLDLDRFKQINDSLGHAAGDAVLRAVAERLSAAIRSSDTAARVGGDEFAILVDDVTGDADVTATAERILRAAQVPISTSVGQVNVTVSIGSASVGVSATQPPSTTVEGALHHADLALHRAKAGGRNQHVAFDEVMSHRARAALEQEQALRASLDEQQIAVVYQPIVAMPDRTLVGVEALARWTRPDGAVVAPEDFIATAEDAGLIDRLGQNVLTQACRQAAAWPTDPRPLQLAVNVSALELRRSGYADAVLAVLADTGLPAHRLELEITESQWLQHDARVLHTLRRLDQAGVRVVLDDFGTGYSSFAHLADMPVTGIKIDRSFVGDAPENARSASLVRAVLCMARELDLQVTAEGVETESHWELLSGQGCHRAQGWLLGRPTDGADPRA